MLISHLAASRQFTVAHPCQAVPLAVISHVVSMTLVDANLTAKKIYKTLYY